MMLLLASQATMLQLQSVSHNRNVLDGILEIFTRMRGGHAKARTTSNDGCGRVSHYDDGHAALKHFAGEGSNFGGVEEEHGDDGAVIVAVHNEAAVKEV